MSHEQTRARKYIPAKGSVMMSKVKGEVGMM